LAAIRRSDATRCRDGRTEREILTGEDKGRDFSHLSEADRKTILEILDDTKPDWKN